MDLLEMRKKIDEIDTQIVELFERRMKISEQVADFKIKTGKQVFDAKREQEKIAAVRELTHNAFNAHGVEELFTQIMAMSRKLQYQLLEANGVEGRLPFTKVEYLEKEKARVVFQGVEGAYSYAAMQEYFSAEVNSFHVDTFREAMLAIQHGEADFAVLPIENSSAGIVNDIYDLLVEYDNYIVGEHIIKVEHALMGLAGTELADIKKVFSHPQGLMQCKSFLEKYKDWEQIPVTNTAVAAKKVLEEQDKSQAAIASKTAAEYFGLEILDDQVYYNEANSTRFIIVTNQKIFAQEADKVSICFELPHKSGTLYNILSNFIYNNLSMNKIESRPLTGRNWEYRFFIDFDGNLEDNAVKNALRGIANEAINLKILGNYKSNS